MANVRLTCREEHPELIEERKKSDLPEKPKTPQQLWYNHEKKTYMKLHPEVHTKYYTTTAMQLVLVRVLVQILRHNRSESWTRPDLHCVSVPGQSEGAEGGFEETVVPIVRQEETQVDQQGPGAPEGL